MWALHPAAPIHLRGILLSPLSSMKGPIENKKDGIGTSSLDWFAVHDMRNFWQASSNMGKTSVRMIGAFSPSKIVLPCSMATDGTAAWLAEPDKPEPGESPGRPSSSATIRCPQSQRANSSALRVCPNGSHLPFAWFRPGSSGLLNGDNHLSVFISLVHWGIKDWLQVLPWFSVLRLIHQARFLLGQCHTGRYIILPLS